MVRARALVSDRLTKAKTGLASFSCRLKPLRKVRTTLFAQSFKGQFGHTFDVNGESDPKMDFDVPFGFPSSQREKGAERQKHTLCWLPKGDGNGARLHVPSERGAGDEEGVDTNGTPLRGQRHLCSKTLVAHVLVLQAQCFKHFGDQTTWVIEATLAKSNSDHFRRNEGASRARPFEVGCRRRRTLSRRQRLRSSADPAWDQEYHRPLG